MISFLPNDRVKPVCSGHSARKLLRASLAYLPGVLIFGLFLRPEQAVSAQAILQGQDLPAGVVRSGDLTYLKSTHVYKTVEGHPIRADVYRVEETRERPAILWMHGGALMGGSRGEIFQFQIEQYLRAGLTVVSIDYRLAPETKLIGIVEDVRDAYAWVRAEAGKLGIDRDRVGVVGVSAGGYLALMMGFRVEPKPQVVASFFGYGDIAANWLTKPSAHYNQQPLVTLEQAQSAIGIHAMSESTDAKRGLIYLYSRQKGKWPEMVMGQDPEKSPDAFQHFLPLKSVGADWPPTILIHGTADTDVPYEQSFAMAQALRQRGVIHELITVPNAGHGLVGADYEAFSKAQAGALDFIRRHLEGSPRRAR